MVKSSDDEEKPVVAEAAGSAATSDSPPAGAMMSIEEAMSQAVKNAYEDAEEVWARQDLSEEDKAKMSAEIVNPGEIKRRMLEAREKVRSAAQG